MTIGFRNLEIKRKYDSDEENVVEKFYVPVLSHAVRYRRLAGFFSSTSLAIAARGISGLIKNSGKMQMVAGAILRKEDVEAIEKGLKQREEILSNNLMDVLETTDDRFIRNHVRALGWMIAHGLLEIKIATLLDQDGLPMDDGAVASKGIYHMKVGIFEDVNSDKISFNGSVNESAMGWIRNVEGFHVFKSWDNDFDHLREDITTFEKFWNGNTKRVLISNLPEAVRKKMVELAPNDIDELELENLYRIDKINHRTESITLRSYQEDAITAWFNNSNHGVFEMATGTGKTITSTSAALKLVDKLGRLAIVIVCPYKHLVEQWKEAVEGFGIKPILAYEGRAKWESELNTLAQEYSLSLKNVICAITTYDSFVSNHFQAALKRIRGSLLLIADEVHHIGSQVAREMLPDNAQFRLGLSATPERWFDPEGTATIFKYFGKVVYSYSLKQAIDAGYLTPYEYRPLIVTLTLDEIERYKEKSSKIARLWHIIGGDESNEKLQALLRERAEILNTAEEKLPALRALLHNIDPLDHLLVYCDPPQINEIMKMLGEEEILAHRFTAREDMKTRLEILNNFEKRRYKAMVAMHCLDEGVDVPPTRTAVIMASSTNPRQFVQRRGRILRKHPGKELAVIYDLITIPPFPSGQEREELEMEQKIIKRELERFEEFASSAINEFEARSIILDKVKRFGVSSL